MIVEDLDAFLADFGEDGLLDGEAVRVIFGSPYAALPTGDGGMSTSEPRALIKAAAVPASAIEDTEDAVLELPEAATLRPGTPTRWYVTEIQPDGLGGFSTLLLRAAPAAE